MILDAPVTSKYPQVTSYASLAASGTLDSYASRKGQQDLSVTVSGYGLTADSPNASHVISYRSRLMAMAEITNVNSHNTAGFSAQLSGNPGQDQGGTCFGDSGGPILPDSTDIITAVNSFVQGSSRQTCGGTSFAYRTDTDAVIAWILDVAGSQAGLINIVSY